MACCQREVRYRQHAGDCGDGRPAVGNGDLLVHGRGGLDRALGAASRGDAVHARRARRDPAVVDRWRRRRRLRDRRDGFAAVFGRADEAVAAAVAAQRALTRFDWPDGLALRVRMGLHTGEGHERDGDYFGPAVNRAARVMDAANGSQILLSASTREVVGHELGAATTLVDLGVQELRDVVEPVRLYRLEDPAFESDRRPPRTGGVRAGNLPSAPGVLLGRALEVETLIDGPRRWPGSSRSPAWAGSARHGWRWRWAEDSKPTRRDGVWFAALDTVDRPDAMGRVLLGLLGIEPRGER